MTVTDIFKSIKDHNGSFKESLSKDVEGMLSLYEASHLAFPGEDLLDEAREFTRTHLNDLIRSGDLSKDVAGEISHKLELPLHQRMQRLEARRYIEACGKRSDANRFLLEFAKWDFNTLQSTLKNDLKGLSSWWVDMGLANKLSFARDRLMESFFWAVGMAFEPQYSKLHKELTKVAAFITVIDDVYDVYGTVDELELFTDAVERWEVKGVENLPDCMRICFLALYNTVNDLVYDILKEHDVYVLPYLRKAAELELGETTNSIACIMSDIGLSEESARQRIRNLVEETWKKMNKDAKFNDSPFAKPFVETAINLARIAQCQYQHGDGHGNPDARAKNRVSSLIIDPIQ